MGPSLRRGPRAAFVRRSEDCGSTGPLKQRVHEDPFAYSALAASFNGTASEGTISLQFEGVVDTAMKAALWPVSTLFGFCRDSVPVTDVFPIGQLDRRWARGECRGSTQLEVDHKDHKRAVSFAFYRREWLPWI